MIAQFDPNQNHRKPRKRDQARHAALLKEINETPSLEIDELYPEAILVSSGSFISSNPNIQHAAHQPLLPHTSKTSKKSKTHQSTNDHHRKRNYREPKCKEALQALESDHDLPSHSHKQPVIPPTNGTVAQPPSNVPTDATESKRSKGNANPSESKLPSKPKDMLTLIEEFLDFPKKYQCQFTLTTLLRFLPLPVAAICYERRIDQVFLMTNKEAKSGLITELSTHIIIDCLFLTITATPIYNNQLQLDSRIQQIVAVLFYLTFNLQLVSILLNGILIFTLIEIPNHLIREWGMERKSCFLYVARVHTLGMYCFLGCSLLWPVATFSHPDYIITWIATIVPSVITLGIIG
jgi:hypothetical protein